MINSFLRHLLFWVRSDHGRISYVSSPPRERKNRRLSPAKFLSLGKEEKNRYASPHDDPFRTRHQSSDCIRTRKSRRIHGRPPHPCLFHGSPPPQRLSSLRAQYIC